VGCCLLQVSRRKSLLSVLLLLVPRQMKTLLLLLQLARVVSLLCRGTQS
jgi:hypothetical protein